MKRITIDLDLPEGVGCKYSSNFLTTWIEELIGKSLELPHPDVAGTNFDAKISSVKLTATRRS